MLSNMKNTAASSCSKAKVTLRPKTFSRPMFNGTTGRKQGHMTPQPPSQPEEVTTEAG